MNPPAPAPPPVRRGTCMECRTERVRLIESTHPVTGNQCFVCAVCSANFSRMP